jgi:hypothetical protein
VVKGVIKGVGLLINNNKELYFNYKEEKKDNIKVNIAIITIF